MFGVDTLAQPGCIGGAPLQGEVLTADHHPALIDLAEAHHVVGWHIFDQLIVIVVYRTGGGASVFTKGAGIKDLVYTLTDRQTAPGVLFGNARLTALLLRQMTAPLQFIDLMLPAHGLFRIFEVRWTLFKVCRDRFHLIR